MAICLYDLLNSHSFYSAMVLHQANARRWRLAACNAKLTILLSVLLIPQLPVASSDELTCGIWFAKSTIPGAGYGIFAGKDFEEKQGLLPIGDVVVPLVDMELHQHGTDYNFLWDEYTWTGDKLLMGFEGLSDELSAASPGFGAAINCFMDLVNVEETIPLNTNEGLHRSKDPGVGGFSTYWNRSPVATKPIKAGNELFALCKFSSYAAIWRADFYVLYRAADPSNILLTDFISDGDDWFTSRAGMGHVPLEGDLHRAHRFIVKYSLLEERLQSEAVKKEILQDLWESFVWKNPWNDTSRVMFAVPKNWEETRLARNITLTELKRRQHSVSVEWLEEHGECGDWITIKPSTIRQAGRGAFARKTLKEGEVVAPFPVIHVPYRARLDIFEISRVGRHYKVNEDQKINTQLLENYCMGHNESTMLLCPYGTLSNHINHNQTLANVKLVWADPSKSNHSPEFLNKSVKELDETEHAGLAMNVVAIRDIQPDEEIFLDYGDEWEKAWQVHVENWTPVDGAENYKSAEQINKDLTNGEFELLLSPYAYPDNVNLYFSNYFKRPRKIWLKYWENGTLDEYMVKEGKWFLEEVEVLHRETDEDGNTWYTVLVPRENSYEKKKQEKSRKISGVPLEAFRFFDRAYTTDMFQANSFRHDIRIPDHLFPDLWKNKKIGGDEQEIPWFSPENESVCISMLGD